jgi:hypothetical protein
MQSCNDCRLAIAAEKQRTLLSTITGKSSFFGRKGYSLPPEEMAGHADAAAVERNAQILGLF